MSSDPATLSTQMTIVLPWKGVALWKAARNSDTVWFIVLLIVNTLAILEILYIFVFSKKKESNKEV